MSTGAGLFYEELDLDAMLQEDVVRCASGTGLQESVGHAEKAPKEICDT